MTPLLLIVGLILLGLTAVWPWLFYAVLLVGFLALLTAMIENTSTDDDNGGEARP